MNRYKIRRQKPVKGGRTPLPSCVLKAIHTEVQRTADRFRVSRSFVIATALADAFGVTVEERYDGVTPRTRRRES